MNRLPVLILATSTALAAPAFARTVTEYSYACDPDTKTCVESQTVVYDDAIPASATYVAPSTYVAPGTVTTYYEPVSTVTYVEDPIIVTAPYMTEDQAITSEVMDRIYNDPGITGRVGVDTFNNVVTLSGRVGTPWQADKAVRHAQNTPGVREVNTQLMSRIGGG
jgi:osmotically-inducible protein OsmY